LEAAAQPTAVSTPASRGAETFDLVCERGILAVLVAVLVYSVLAFGGVRTPDFVIVQGMTIVGLALWLVRIWFKPRFRLLWPPLSWAVVAFVVYAVFRCVTDKLLYPARHELSTLLTYASLFFIASNNMTRRNSATVISMALVCVGFSISGLAIYQFATHNGNIWGMHKPAIFLTRASGTFVNPNHLAGFLEMVVPLSIAYMFMGRLSAIVKVLLGYCSLMMLVAICMTLSRGGMIAVGVTVIVLLLALLLQRDHRLKAVLAIVVLLVLAGGALTEVGTIERRFNKSVSDSGNIEDVRVRIWQAAKEIYLKEPVLGPGPGHFDYEFRAHAPKAMVQRAQFAHNDYLNALCDWGAVGLAMLVACVLLLYQGVLKTWPFVRKQSNEIGSTRSNKGAFVFGAAFSTFAILLHSFTDFNLHIPSNAIVAVVLGALLTAHWRFATERFWLNPYVPGRIVLSLVIAALGFYLGDQALKDRREFVWLDRADHSEAYTSEKQTALMRAWEIAPDNYLTAYEIGECLRLQSWAGRKGYQDLAKEAMNWDDRAAALNPYDPYIYLRHGMCMDWLDRHDEAGTYFDKALQLCPNDFYVLTYDAWHKMQIEDWKEANRILHYALSFSYNDVAKGYLELTEKHLADRSMLKP
jgi:O-antigen ligase